MVAKLNDLCSFGTKRKTFHGECDQLHVPSNDDCLVLWTHGAFYIFMKEVNTLSI